MTRPRRFLTLGLTLLVTGLVLATLIGRRIEANSRSEAVAPGLLAVATERQFTPSTLATGSIRLLPGARIEVGARVSGVVQRLLVTQGSRVQRGDVIARLDTLESAARVGQAEARLTELAATAQQAEADLLRTESLARVEGVTQQELSVARTTLATVRARLAGVKADLALARVQQDYTTIKAPITGVVASVTTHEGETVAASLAAPTFVTLLDPTLLECVALVDETDIGHVALQDAAEFTVDAFPARSFHGTVVRIAPDATVIGGVVDYEVTIRVSGDTGDLKPQMTASIAIAGKSRTSLVIPVAAVQQSPEGPYVWRRKQGAPQRVPVRLGAREREVTEVRAGLARGDTVLTGAFPTTK